MKNTPLIRQAIQSYMAHNDKTQSTLGEMLGVAQTTVGDWINGETTIIRNNSWIKLYPLIKQYLPPDEAAPAYIQPEKDKELPHLAEHSAFFEKQPKLKCEITGESQCPLHDASDYKKIAVKEISNLDEDTVFEFLSWLKRRKKEMKEGDLSDLHRGEHAETA